MVKVLLVDDSPTIIEVMKLILSGDSEIEIVGTARNGQQALEMVHALRPDVVMMDLAMPVMDGVEATRRIMAECPTAIIIVSAHAEGLEADACFQATENGALAVVPKPPSITGPDFPRYQRELLNSAKGLARVHPIMRRPDTPPHSTPDKGIEPARPPRVAAALRTKIQVEPTRRQTRLRREVVGIACSTGGPMALKTILTALPSDFPLPIVVVQHISKGFLPGMVNWMQTFTGLRVRVAANGDVLKPGHVYMAPDGFQTTVARRGGNLVCRLVDSPAVGGFKPSGNALLASLAEVCGEMAIGVVLTGMGRDGAEGLGEMRRRNGLTVAEHEESCVVYGMPKVAIESGAAANVVRLPFIARFLIQNC